MTENKFKIGFTSKGEYSNSVAYNTLDVVSYNNGAYVSIIDENLGNLPTKETYWKILVNPTTINNAVASSTTATNAAISATNLAINAANAANAAIVDINDIISKKIDTKFGFQRAVANTEAGTYTIESFGSSDLADQYDQDPTGNIGNLLNSYQILMGSGSGGGSGGSTIYKVRCVNNLPSLYFSAAKNDPCYINFTFTSVDADNVNTNETGTCHLFIKNGSHPTYTEVSTFSVVSNFIINRDISSLLTDGYNYVMLKVVGEVSEAMAPALVYTINLTSLSLDISSFTWWIAKTSDFVLPCSIGGNVKKSLHVQIVGSNYDEAYTVDLGTATYIDTSYNYTVVKPPIAGVYTLKAYVINSDGTVQTVTSQFNFMARIENDSSNLLVINSLKDKLTNWNDNTVLSYATCNSVLQTSNVSFVLKKGTNVVYSTNEEVQTNIKNQLLYTMGIDTPDNSNFNLTIDCNNNGTPLISTITLPVDNSLSFSAVGGYSLYINPKTRSNLQTNYTDVINEADGSTITATWSNMNWSIDGWTTDDNNKKVLRLFTNEKVVINKQLLKTECAATGKTIEIKARVSNVSDYSDPWLVIGAVNNQNNFVGIKIFPDNILWYTQLKNNEETQSYPLNDEVEITFGLCIVPNTYGNVGYNTVYFYIDGKKCRAFNYESNDLFSTDGNIEIGSTGCDVDIYAIRVYESGLSSSSVFNNYVNLLSSRDEKITLASVNDVFNTEDTALDFNKVNKLKNTFTFSNSLPNKANPSNTTGTLSIIYPTDATKNLTITNVTAAGQGSTSKGYYEWNIKFTINSNSVLTYPDGTTVTGGKWTIDPSVPAGSKFTAKLNWASMSQDHKCGSVNAYTDLYKALGFTNPGIAANSKARVSVYQQPFVGFTAIKNEDNEIVYTFAGEYTIGPDKGDKYCFNYDTTAFPNLISIEGSDNAPLPALYRVPWNTNRITYQVVAARNIDGWVYNDAATFDFNSGKTDNISQFIPAYNLVHSCSNLIMPFNGTLDELNAQIATYRITKYMYWISKVGDTNYGNVYYYEAGEQLYIGDDIGSGTINLFTQLVDKGYGLVTADTVGKTDSQLNTLFINARIQKARLEWGTLWDINDALFHDCWVELTAGTDQRAKNTYPYIFGTTNDKKVRWRVDDMDTIWPTNNQGLLTKRYSTEVGDTYEDGAPEWNGETSVFHNVLALAFKAEMAAMMNNILASMESLSGLSTGTDYDKLLAWYNKYYVSVKNYFPAKIVNEFVKHFENAELKYKTGDYQSDTEPIAQVVGDAMSPDVAFVKKRLVYIMSKYGIGLFSSKSSGAITVRAAGNEITYNLTTAIDMYPNIANGESVIRGNRTYANNTCEMVINLGGSSDQQNTILGADYLTDIGDWHNKNVHGAMSITGKRLMNILLGSKIETPTISITALTLGNCYSLRKLELTGISTLQGVLDLTNCKNLQEVYAEGTSLTNIKFTEGGMLSKLELPNTLQSLFLVNFSKLTTDNFKLNSAPIRYLWLEGMDGLDTLSTATSCSSTLTNVRLTKINGLSTELFDIYALSLLGGIDNSGNLIASAVLSGTYHVEYARKDLLDALAASCPNLTITYEHLYHKPNITIITKDQTNAFLSDVTVVINGDTLTTDSNGSCVYPSITANTYSITASKDGYITATANGNVYRDDITITLQLTKIYTITFTSNSTYGNLLAGCNITIGSETITTGSNGVAVFSRPPGTYSYSATYMSQTPSTGSITITNVNVTKTITFTGTIAELQPVPNGNIQVAINGSSSSVSCSSNSVAIISWGDGSTTQMNGASYYTHSYAVSNFYQIEIQNCSQLTKLTVNESILVAYWSIGNSLVKDLNFYYYTKLACVGSDIFKNDTTKTSFYNCFYNCTALTTIPSDLFKYNTAVTTFDSCFTKCTALTTIPSDLFKYNTLVTSFANCFYYCYNLKTIPSDLFRYNTAVTTFDSCFKQCTTGLTTIPTDLFKYNTLVTSFANCFYYCYNLTTIPAGLFDYTTSVTTFDSCFYYCYNFHEVLFSFKHCPLVTTFESCFSNCAHLTTIPDDLFSNCTSASIFDSCFYQCIALTEIPIGLFNSTTSATSFTICFYNCTALTTIPSDLFKYNTAVTSFASCFNYCSLLTTIPANLFNYNGSVTNFGGLFNSCQKLTAIPTDLFKYNTAVTSFSSCFSGCKLITTIPTGLFSTNTSVTSFDSCFMGCTNLTTVPVDLFENNSAVITFDSCFMGCSVLSSCVLPTSFANLGTSSYKNCTSLQYIKTTRTTPQTLGYDIFTNTNNCPIYVPTDYVATYKAASGWSLYSSRIQAIPS